MGVCKSAEEVRQAVHSGLTLCHSTAEVMGSLETRSGLVMASRSLRGGWFISPVAGAVQYLPEVPCPRHTFRRSILDKVLLSPFGTVLSQLTLPYLLPLPKPLLPHSSMDTADPLGF